MEDSTTIQQLNQKVNYLQSAVDSLNKLSSVRQITYELQQKQDVITAVNNFYDSAWLKLLIVISVLGILIPILAQYYQRQSLKDLTEFIRKQMNDSLQLKIEELKSYSKQEINHSILELNSTIKDIEIKNQLLLTEIDASTYYLQGRASVLSKQYSLAIQSFLKSAYLYLKSERPERSTVQFVNLKLCLKSIKDNKIISESSKSLKESSFNWTLEEMLDYFKSHPSNELYVKHFNTIIEEIERIKKQTLL